VYGTCPGLPVNTGEVHRRHRHQQRGIWWSSVTSKRWQRTDCGLLQGNCVQDQEKLLFDPSRVAVNYEDRGAFSQVLVWTRVPLTQRPLLLYLAPKLWDFGEADSSTDSASAGKQLHI
jgi:hypothetical protein